MCVNNLLRLTPNLGTFGLDGAEDEEESPVDGSIEGER